MPSWCIVSTEYDVDLRALYARRLAQLGVNHSLSCKNGSLFVTVRGSNALNTMAAVSAKVLCRDLQYFVLAAFTDRMPLSLYDKQTALTSALHLARAHEDLLPVEQGLVAFLENTRDLCLEGYLRFRLKSLLTLWQLCVEQAAADILLKKDINDLIATLNACCNQRESKISELQVCIHADGSCTLTDDSLIRIEYVDCSIEGIVTLLVNMAPEHLIVYDLSGRDENSLTQAIARVFGGRARIYR
ncbi:MAG: sporulation protein YtxC [Clostridia bacterium]|nr:sporulation protein YtxC [Clostridia bacterium]